MTCVYPGLIDTGMFTGVKHTFQFLTPHLQPEDVANAIIKALKDNRSSRVLLPFYVNLVNLLFRGLPIEILDWAKNATFANTEMAGFTHSASDQKKTN
ncbi:hypothetical protein HK102_013274 [Quaeritorhiza haematococci]|nr:hypothetical protein HK102_013274 [Quaeritorhiza haematococci]